MTGEDFQEFEKNGVLSENEKPLLAGLHKAVGRGRRTAFDEGKVKAGALDSPIKLFKTPALIHPQ